MLSSNAMPTRASDACQRLVVEQVGQGGLGVVGGEQLAPDDQRAEDAGDEEGEIKQTGHPRGAHQVGLRHVRGNTGRSGFRGHRGLLRTVRTPR